MQCSSRAVPADPYDLSPENAAQLLTTSPPSLNLISVTVLVWKGVGYNATKVFEQVYHKHLKYATLLRVGGWRESI